MVSLLCTNGGIFRNTEAVTQHKIVSLWVWVKSSCSWFCLNSKEWKVGSKEAIASQRSQISPWEPQGLSSSGVWKEFIVFCLCVRQRLRAHTELLAPTEFSKELGASQSWEPLPLTADQLPLTCSAEIWFRTEHASSHAATVLDYGHGKEKAVRNATYYC